MSDFFTEQALRMAVNTSKSAVKGEITQISSLKDAALGRVNELIKGNNTAANIGSELNVQALAINAAIQTIELSVFAVNNQLNNLKNTRLTFDKERQAGIASFQIRINKEENELSEQEQVMKAFFELVQRNPILTKYLGIQKSTSQELDSVEFYSVLPYYKMSGCLAQPVASTKKIDKKRTEISLFFNSALPDAIADIDNDFQSENKFIEFIKSAFTNENYLNDLRAPRFIMIALANLLWNLQHPVDPETGYPFSIGHSIELCKTMGLFLNKLLNRSEKTSLYPLSNSTNKLISCVQKVELRVKVLKNTYTEEHLYELNIDDLTNNAHQTLRTLDTSVFELIYRVKNPLTNKEQPDTRAAGYLASMVSYLHELLIDSPELIRFFAPFAHNAENTPFFNNPPQTIIDVLILFIHSSRADRESLYSSLAKNNFDTASELLNTLKEFDQRFIKPIKAVSKIELKAGIFDKKTKEVAKLTASRLVPLITLVLEDHRVDVDIPYNNLASATHSVNQEVKTYTAGEQVREINAAANKASRANKDDYYVWELSPFIDANDLTESEIDKLPKHQYRFTEITKLLDSITEIVQNYRTFLQYKAFQLFLINCLNKIKNEYTELGRYIDQIDSFLSKDKKLNRNMQNILGPMTTTITSSLDDFSQAFSTFEQIMTAPDFTEQQKNSLANKIGSIHQEFLKLFGEDSGISVFATSASLEPPSVTVPMSKLNEIKPTPVPTIYQNDKESLQPQQIVELGKLIKNCINALSLQSHYGYKGKLLHQLLTQVESQKINSQKQLEHTIHQLARITLSYRPSYFFQAAYAETASAKALVAAIKDPKLNTLIPIASLLLGDQVKAFDESESIIAQRLKNLRIQNNWELSSDDIQIKPAHDEISLSFNF